MTNPPAEAETPLLFEWAPPKGEKFLITAFLIGSLFVHGLAFYMFRIIYPASIAVLPPSARLTFIGPNSEDGRTLLRWIEAEDPALASATVRPPEAKLRALPRLAHVPSYLIQEPKLKNVPPPNTAPTTADAFPPGPAPILRQSEPPWPKSGTRAFVSDELQLFGELKVEPARFSSSTAEAPENARFRIAVDRSGAIHYCFKMNSSGDTKLDEQARLWLVRGLFANNGGNNSVDDEKLSWGVVTIEWGNDIILPKNPTSPATP
jgi:hypothetical protein